MWCRQENPSAYNGTCKYVGWALAQSSLEYGKLLFSAPLIHITRCFNKTKILLKFNGYDSLQIEEKDEYKSNYYRYSPC